MTPSQTPRPVAAAEAAARGLLDAILETSDDAILSHDMDGRIVTWNPTAERYFGQPGADILGQRSVDLFAEHLRGEIEAVFDQVRAGDRVDRFETEILRGDGMPVPISLSLCPVLGPDGQPVASLLIARDITEQRLAQASLAEIEARVRDSEELANVGSWLWDRRTGAVQWSDEFHRIHGLDPLEFDGTLDAHLARVHPSDRAVVGAGMAGSAESGRAFDEQYRIVRPDDEVRLVHARAQPMIGSDGAVVGLRGIGQDITERA